VRSRVALHLEILALRHQLTCPLAAVVDHGRRALVQLERQPGDRDRTLREERRQTRVPGSTSLFIDSAPDGLNGENSRAKLRSVGEDSSALPKGLKTDAGPAPTTLSRVR